MTAVDSEGGNLIGPNLNKELQETNGCLEQEKLSVSREEPPMGYPMPSGHPEIICMQSYVLNRRAAIEEAAALTAVDLFDLE